MNSTNILAKLFQIIAVCSLASSATAQIVTVTNYNSANFNTNAGYVRGYSIIADNQPAGIRWNGNDPYSPITEEGETDNIMRMIGYTPGASALGNSSLVQGGFFAGDAIFPGTNNVQIWKSFTPVATTGDSVTFKAQWSLIGSLDGSFPNLDVFAFDLRTQDNSQSLLRLSLTPGIATIPNAYTLQTTVGTNTAVNRVDIGYQALYEVSVQITGGLYDMSISQLNASNQSVITNLSLVTGAALTTGLTGADFGTVGLDWELASGVNTEPGSNYIIVNNIVVSTTGTPIPESGTWAVGLLLAGVLGLHLKRRHTIRTSESA